MLGIYFVIKTFLKLYVIVVIIIFAAVDLLWVRLLSVLRGHLVFFFHSCHKWPMNSDFEGFPSHILSVSIFLSYLSS